MSQIAKPTADGGKKQDESGIKDTTQPSISTTRPRVGSLSRTPADLPFAASQAGTDGIKNVQRNAEIAQQKRREILEAEDKDFDEKLSDAVSIQKYAISIYYIYFLIVGHITE